MHDYKFSVEYELEKQDRITRIAQDLLKHSSRFCKQEKQTKYPKRKPKEQ